MVVIYNLAIYLCGSEIYRFNIYRKFIGENSIGFLSLLKYAQNLKRTKAQKLLPNQSAET